LTAFALLSTRSIVALSSRGTVFLERAAGAVTRC